jgi:hypothetical protein
MTEPASPLAPGPESVPGAAAGRAPADPAPADAPLKQHGDALVDGSGTRHGSDAAAATERPPAERDR